VPIFRATGEKGSELKGATLEAIDVDYCEVTATRGSDIESESILILLVDGEKFVKGVGDETANTGFAIVLPFGPVISEEVGDLVGFEVEAFDFIIRHATVNRGPWNEAFGSPAGAAHVFLLEHFGKPRTISAVLDELFAREFRAADFVDFFDKAESDRVEEIDAIITPTAFALSGFATEGGEEGVGTVMGRPDGQAEVPGDAT